MANNKRLNESGKETRFSHENQPENRGRKPSILKKYIKRYDISKGDVESIIECILFDHTFGKLGEIRNDKERLKALLDAETSQDPRPPLFTPKHNPKDDDDGGL
jgi:hypothetical protein